MGKTRIKASEAPRKVGLWDAYSVIAEAMRYVSTAERNPIKIISAVSIPKKTKQSNETGIPKQSLLSEFSA